MNICFRSEDITYDVDFSSLSFSLEFNIVIICLFGYLCDPPRVVCCLLFPNRMKLN